MLSCEYNIDFLCKLTDFISPFDKVEYGGIERLNYSTVIECKTLS